MDRARQYWEKKVAALGLWFEKEDPDMLEAWCGTLDGLFSEEELDAFRDCGPDDARVLNEFLWDERRRHFVKALVSTALAVPERIFDGMVHASVHTRNVSFNRHFVWPCICVGQQRRTVRELLRYCREGSNREKAGADSATTSATHPAFPASRILKQTRTPRRSLPSARFPPSGTMPR